METLPCGCHMGTDVIAGVKTFLYEPCAMDCENFRYMMEEAERQAKPLTTIDAR